MHLAPPLLSLLKVSPAFLSHSKLTSLNLCLSSLPSSPANSYISYYFPNTSHPQILPSSRNLSLLYVSPFFFQFLPLLMTPNFHPILCHNCLPNLPSPDMSATDAVTQGSFISYHTPHCPESPHVAPSFQSHPITPISASYPQPPAPPLP